MTDSTVAGRNLSQPSRIGFDSYGIAAFAEDTSPRFLVRPTLKVRLPWIEEVRAGWPVPSVMGRPLQMGTPLVESFDRGIFPPKWVYLFNPEPGRRVPLRPVWPGFAINTIFYATLLWLPFAPFALRRIIRRKRGRCIKCGYDLRGALHAGCPECGWRRREKDAEQPA